MGTDYRPGIRMTWWAALIWLTFGVIMGVVEWIKKRMVKYDK